jgi:hypothetical protein
MVESGSGRGREHRHWLMPGRDLNSLKCLLKILMLVTSIVKCCYIMVVYETIPVTSKKKQKKKKQKKKRSFLKAVRKVSVYPCNEYEYYTSMRRVSSNVLTSCYCHARINMGSNDEITTTFDVTKNILIM